MVAADNMVTLTKIEELCRLIVANFHPLKVLLFGSYAAGTASINSDVDLLVILPFSERPLTKSLEILNKVNPDFPIDLIVRGPDDTERRYAEGDPMIRDAMDNGKVLYERND
ncbi:MAG: nucleotidyltransferase domain-containing protein [bacterium]|nr:nucleotidyltransferase domain-containing protein [bacterium]